VSFGSLSVPLVERDVLNALDMRRCRLIFHAAATAIVSVIVFGEADPPSQNPCSYLSLSRKLKSKLNIG